MGLATSFAVRGRFGRVQRAAGRSVALLVRARGPWAVGRGPQPLNRDWGQGRRFRAPNSGPYLAAVETRGRGATAGRMGKKIESRGSAKIFYCRLSLHFTILL